MPRRRKSHRRWKKRAETKYANIYIPENSEIEKSNRRDIALLEHGWSPDQTKFGEEFKGKNKILIVEKEK
jgi:hypothetical protein